MPTCLLFHELFISTVNVLLEFCSNVGETLKQVRFDHDSFINFIELDPDHKSVVSEYIQCTYKCMCMKDLVQHMQGCDYPTFCYFTSCFLKMTLNINEETSIDVFSGMSEVWNNDGSYTWPTDLTIFQVRNQGFFYSAFNDKVHGIESSLN